MIGYSPQFPLQIDNEVGAYALTHTLREVASQHFRNLLLTSPGERVMDNNFGVGLRQYLFQPNTASLRNIIATRMRDQASQYLPYMVINTVVFNEAAAANGELLLKIAVNFSIPTEQNVQTLVVDTAQGIV